MDKVIIYSRNVMKFKLLNELSIILVVVTAQLSKNDLIVKYSKKPFKQKPFVSTSLKKNLEEKFEFNSAGVPYFIHEPQ